MKYKLKDLGIVSTGNTPSKSNEAFYDSEDIAFVKPDILSDCRVTEKIVTMEYISENARNKARIVDNGAVFVTCIGSIGKIGLADMEFAFNQQINAIQPNDKVNSKYLAYCMLYNKKKLQLIANAPVVPIINKSQFEEFEVEIEEDINKQKKIVKILDKVNYVIASREKELEELDTLIKSRFVEMMNQYKSNNPLSDYITVFKAERCGERDIPVLSITKEDGIVLQSEKFKKRIASVDASTYKVVPKGKLVQGIHIDERNFAIQNIVDVGIVSPAYKIWNVDETKAIPEVLAFAMRTDRTMAYISSKFTGTVKRRESISMADFMLTPIDLPDIGIQSEFYEFMNQVNKLKSEVQKSLNETQILFDSLMQEYFG